MPAKINKEFEKILKKDKKEFEKSIKKIKEFYKKNNMTSGKKILPFFLTACFLKKEQIKKLNTDLKKLSKIINKIVKKYLNSRFQDIIRLTKDEKDIIEMGYKTINLFSRYDIFLYNNNFKLIEINSESPSGMGRISLIEDIFLKTKQFSELKKRFKIKKPGNIKKTLLKNIIKTCNKKNPNIAIVDWKKAKTISDQYYLKDYFNKYCKTFVCEPTDLKFKKNNLYYNKDKIDIIYRRFLTSDYLKEKQKFAPIIKALKNKSVCMLNPFASYILNDKSFLSNLRAGYFNSILKKDDIRLIKRIIPWSIELNSITVRNYPGGIEKIKKYLLKNKNKLVLKPSVEYGGTDVFIGKDTNKKQWKKIINKSLKQKKWIAQEFLKIPQITAPIIKNNNIQFRKKYINLSPFVINNNTAGFLARISESKVINTSKGGGIIPTFII